MHPEQAFIYQMPFWACLLILGALLGGYAVLKFVAYFDNLRDVERDAALAEGVAAQQARGEYVEASA